MAPGNASALSATTLFFPQGVNAAALPSLLISAALAGRLLFKADETRQGTVTQIGSKPALLLSGVLLPLPSGSPLIPGDLLDVNIVPSASGWVLKLTIAVANPGPVSPRASTTTPQYLVDSEFFFSESPTVGAPPPPVMPGALKTAYVTPRTTGKNAGTQSAVRNAGVSPKDPGKSAPPPPVPAATDPPKTKNVVITAPTRWAGWAPDRPVLTKNVADAASIDKTMARWIETRPKPVQIKINTQSPATRQPDGHEPHTLGSTADILCAKQTGEPAVLGIEQSNPLSRINPIVVDNNAVRITEPVARDLGLQDGEIVKGIVRQDGDALKLVLNGLPLLLSEGHGFKSGDTPTFRIVQTEAGLLLQPLRQPLSATAVNSGAVGAATSETIPKAAAGTPNTLLSLLLHPPQLPALTQMLSSGLIARAMTALGIPEMAASFQKAQPAMGRLNAATLRKAVAGAGLWTEANVGQRNTSVDADTKALLLQMTRIADDDSGIKDTARRALVDIESAQLQGVQAQTNHELMLNMVIPFSDANPVRMTFERKAPTKEQPDPPYTVNLHSRNDILGEVWLKTAITGRLEVDMIMWARQPAVAAAATKGAEALSAELRLAGLNLNSFVVYNRARQESTMTTAAPGAIVNVQA